MFFPPKFAHSYIMFPFCLVQKFQSWIQLVSWGRGSHLCQTNSGSTRVTGGVGKERTVLKHFRAVHDPQVENCRMKSNLVWADLKNTFDADATVFQSLLDRRQLLEKEVREEQDFLLKKRMEKAWDIKINDSMGVLSFVSFSLCAQLETLMRCDFSHWDPLSWI